MRVLSYDWVQGRGFQGYPHTVGPFGSYQAAYGRLRRANRLLAEHNLLDWHAQGIVVRREDGRWEINDAQVCEIR